MTRTFNKIITCAGGANVDILGFSNASINLRDSNPGSIRLCAGGVGRNIAENLARMGANIRMVSAVGDDFFGEMILGKCKEAGVDISGIDVIPGAKSSSYLVLTDNDGDMFAAISDMRVIKNLNADFILRHAALFDSSDAIILDPNLSFDCLKSLTDGWRDKPIFADPISITYAGTLKNFLSKLYMVKCNRMEAEVLAGFEIRDSKEMENAADSILREGTYCVVITLGAKGVFYKDRSGLVLRKQHKPVRPVSATGAGDAFTAAMVYGWGREFAPDRCLDLAMEAAEITLTDPLTVSPRVSRITAYLQ